MLNLTGDYNVAQSVTVSVYGDSGADIQAQMAEQMREMVGGYDIEIRLR